MSKGKGDRTRPCAHHRAQSALALGVAKSVQIGRNEHIDVAHVCPQCGMELDAAQDIMGRATWEAFRSARIAAGMDVTDEPAELFADQDSPGAKAVRGMWRREGASSSARRPPRGETPAEATQLYPKTMSTPDGQKNRLCVDNGLPYERNVGCQLSVVLGERDRTPHE